MRAYKFLDATGRAPFSGVVWPRSQGAGPGPWLEAGPVRTCRGGLHACRPGDLPWWLADQLWEVELDGPVVVSRHKVASPRARLVRRVDDYPRAVGELGAVGAWRARDLAVAALGAAGQRDWVGRFSACTTVEQLAGLRRAAHGSLEQSTPAGAAATLAADTALFVRVGAPSEAPFIACCAAAHAAAEGTEDRDRYDAGYVAERVFQAGWLTDRLALDDA